MNRNTQLQTRRPTSFLPAPVVIPYTVTRSCSEALRKMLASRRATIKTREVLADQRAALANAVQESIEIAFGRE